MHIAALIVSGLAAYLLGSVSCSILVSRAFFGQDIRNFGSGNAGMTNVLRTFGKKAAALTLTGDVLKGVVSVLLARHLFSLLAPDFPAAYLVYMAAICSILGHLFPIYFGFRGGKGISVAAGAVLALNPVVLFPLLGLFLVMVFTTRIVSLSSITVAALYPVATWLYYSFIHTTGPENVWVCTAFAAAMGALVVWMHRSNIQRLLNGTEYKFGEKKKEK